MVGEQTLENAKRVGDIGFAEFTADLIQSTFHAIVAANQAQMQDYRDLVAAVSKTTSEYINETKLEVTGEEVLGYLENLPPFLDAKGDEIPAVVGTGSSQTITLEAGQKLPAEAIHQLNKQLNVGDIASGVRSLQWTRTARRTGMLVRSPLRSG